MTPSGPVWNGSLLCECCRLPDQILFFTSEEVLSFFHFFSFEGFKHSFERVSRQSTHFGQSWPFFCMAVKPYLIYAASYFLILVGQEFLGFFAAASSITGLLICLFLVKNLSILG